MASDPTLGGGPGGEVVPGIGLGPLGRKRRWPRRLLISVNVLVLLALVAGASAYGYVQWRLGQVSRISVKYLHDQQPVGSPQTILLVGSDTRNLGTNGSAAFGSAQEVTGQRSDTIVLVRVVPATSSVALLSVPRDLLVPVPGLGTTRVNAAFGGGPDLLVQTIEQDLGITINHFAVVNFATFTQLSDAIGGVYQWFPTPARDLFSGLNVPAGCVLLKGAQALGFVRSREYQFYLDGQWQYQMVPESDLARIQRQQAFIKLALKKAEHVAPTNPLALNSVLSGITSSLTVDSHFSNSLMINLALDMRHVNASGIPDWTYPNVNSASVPGALDPAPAADQQMVHQFLTYGLPASTTTSAAAGATSTTRSASAALQSATIAVLNGSGAAGQAGRVAAALQAAGLKVGTTGNASSFTYTKSVVEYGPGSSALAQALAARIGGGATTEQVPALASGDLVLITGQTYSGILHQASLTLDVLKSVGSPPAAAPASSGTAGGAALAGTTSSGTSSSGAAGLTVPPTGVASSSYYHGQYVPPGLQPGQVPQTCPS